MTVTGREPVAEVAEVVAGTTGSVVACTESTEGPASWSMGLGWEKSSVVGWVIPSQILKEVNSWCKVPGDAHTQASGTKNSSGPGSLKCLWHQFPDSCCSAGAQ